MEKRFGENSHIFSCIPKLFMHFLKKIHTFSWFCAFSHGKKSPRNTGFYLIFHYRFTRMCKTKSASTAKLVSEALSGADEAKGMKARQILKSINKKQPVQDKKEVSYNTFVTFIVFVLGLESNSP
jgi:hypothetical protein